MLFASLLIFTNTNVAQAGWNSINSGYAVTTNYHGLDVPPYEDVTATAGTTDIGVYMVEFIWTDPDGNEISRKVWGPFSTTVPDDAPQEVKDWDDENPGTTVYYAQDTYENVEIPGWWSVRAKFHGATLPNSQDSTRFKASSLFVVDEVPFGTIVILLIPFGFLGIYAIKRKHSIPIDARA